MSLKKIWIALLILLLIAIFILKTWIYRLVYIYLFLDLLFTEVKRNGGVVKKRVQLKHKKRKVLLGKGRAGLNLTNEGRMSIYIFYMRRI